MSFKSPTCKNRQGGALTSYESIDEATQGAAFVKKEHSHDLAPYKCDACSYFHLAPANRQTPMTYDCGCKDSKGKPKALYAKIEHANARAAILKKEQGADVHPYECPKGIGWHLTHKNY